MLGINCLYKDPSIIKDLTNAVRHEAEDLYSKKKRPSLENVYNNLVDYGFEVDIQTIGRIYNSLFSQKNNAAFTSAKEVERLIGDNYSQIIDKRAAAQRKNEMGRDNAVVSTVKSLASLVQQDLRDNPTLQKIFQERLLKAAKRIIEAKGKKVQSQDMTTILQEALTLENRNQFFNMGTLENAQTLFDEFKKEIGEVAKGMEQNNSFGAQQMREFADKIGQASYDLLLSNAEINKVIMETFKESGLTKMMNVNGSDKMVVDWSKVMASGFDFRKTMNDVLLKKGFSQSETNRIVDFFDRQFQQMKVEKSKKAISAINNRVSSNDINRLARLANLDQFKLNRQAIYDFLGTSQVTQEQMNNLEELMKGYNRMMQIGLADLSPTYFKTVERHLRNVIERIQEGHHAGLNVIRKYQMYSQFSSASILLNIGNSLVENTSSGLAEMINTAITNPKLIMKSAKTFFTVLGDVAIHGGVRQGVEHSNIYEESGDAEGRYSREEATKFRHKLGGLAFALQQAILSATDSAVKGYIWKSMEVNGFLATLQAKGLTKDEAYSLINETYFGNQDQVEKMAKQMADSLKANGINVSAGKWKRIAGELAAFNVLSEGKGFQDAVDRLETAGKLRKGIMKDVVIDRDLVAAIREAADGAAARGLGHSADSVLTSWLDRKIIGSKENVKRLSQSGQLGKLARVEMGRAVLGNVFRFRSGGLKWATLNLEKSSGIALAVTLLNDVIYNKKHKLADTIFGSGTKELKNRLEELEEIKKTQPKDTWQKAYDEFKTDLESAYAVKQRLNREMIQPIVSYAMWRFLISPALTSVLERVCDDNTEDCLQRKMKVVMENGWGSIITKMMPIVVQNYLTSLVVHAPTGSDYYNYKYKDDTAGSLINSWVNTINPNTLDGPLGEFFENNIGDDPVYGPIKKIIEARKADKRNGNSNKSAEVLGTFAGNMLNLGGFLKSYDINMRYINAIRGISNSKSSAEYKKTKANGFIQSVIKQNTNNALFEVVKDKIED